MELYLIAGIFIFIWLICMIGCLHLGWYLPCKRELKKNHKLYTPNANKMFLMNVSSKKSKFTKSVITGEYTGELPYRGSVLYLRNQQVQTAVFVNKVTKIDENHVELKVFNAKRFSCSSPTVCTNVRVNVEKPDLYVNVDYLVICKYPVSGVLSTIFIILVGLMNVCIVYLSRNRLRSDIMLIVILFVGGFMTVCGIYLLLNAIFFRFIIDENGIVTHISFNKKVTHQIDALSYSKKVSTDSTNERIYADVCTISGDFVCRISENYPGYDSVLYELDCAKERRKMKDVINYINHRQFYVVVDQNDKIAVFEKGQSEIKGLFLFENKDLLYKYMQNDKVKISKLNIEFILKDCKNVDEVYLYTENQLGVVCLDKAEWKELCGKYGII